MKITKVILIAMSVCFLGCKDQKEEVKTEEAPVVANNVKVTLDVTIKKDDDLQIYYTETTSTDFNEKESLWQHVKGSESPQKIVFNIPEDVLPTMVRLDFGVSDNQEAVKFSGIEFEYYGKKFTSVGEDLANYFRPQTEARIDFKTGLIEARFQDGKRIEPAIFPHEVPLSQALDKLYKNK
jgi:hypothetical protein